FLLPLRHYPGVEVRSDLNVSSLNIMRGDMASGRCKAIVFGEFAKLYARHDTTSMNLEKQLQALVDEGYWSGSTERSNVSLQTDCQIFGAMTDMFYQHHYQRWKEAGFLRRFLFARITLENPNILYDAIEQGKRVKTGKLRLFGELPNEGIPDTTTAQERSILRKILHDHKHGGEGVRSIPYQLLCKALSALKGED